MLLSLLAFLHPEDMFKGRHPTIKWANALTPREKSVSVRSVNFFLFSAKVAEWSERRSHSPNNDIKIA